MGEAIRLGLSKRIGAGGEGEETFGSGMARPKELVAIGSSVLAVWLRHWWHAPE